MIKYKIVQIGISQIVGTFREGEIVKDFLDFLSNKEVRRKDKLERDNIILWAVGIGLTILFIYLMLNILASFPNDKWLPLTITALPVGMVIALGGGSTLTMFITKLIDYRWYKTEWPEEQKAKAEENKRLIYHCAKSIAVRSITEIRSELLTKSEAETTNWRCFACFNNTKLGYYISYDMTREPSEVIYLFISDLGQAVEIRDEADFLEKFRDEIVFACAGRKITYYKPGKWQDEVIRFMRNKGYFDWRLSGVDGVIPWKYLPILEEAVMPLDFEEYSQRICREAHELTHSARGGSADGEFGRAYYYISNKDTEKILIITYQSCPSVFLPETVEIYDLNDGGPCLVFRSVLGYTNFFDSEMWYATVDYFRNAYNNRSLEKCNEWFYSPLVPDLRRF